MKNILITCDRCGKKVDGMISITPKDGVVVTSGYYIVAEGNWKECQRDDEEYVCDQCMWEDPKYKQLYQE
jgi:hypothetical protein